jgi:hypothetical protein
LVYFCFSISAAGRLPFRNTYVGVKGVAVEVPAAQQLGALAGGLGPGVSVNKGGVEGENSNTETKEGSHHSLSNNRLRCEAQALETVEDKVELLAEDHNGEVEGGEIVVQEELTGHKVEWEVMEEPSEYSGANLVVETLERNVLVVTTASLPAQD